SDSRLGGGNARIVSQPSPCQDIRFHVVKGIPAALDLMGPRLDMEVNKERVADLLMAAVRPTMESSAEWREFELIEGPQVKLDVFPIAGDVQRAAVDFEITFRLEHQFYSTEQLKLIDEVE